MKITSQFIRQLSTFLLKKGSSLTETRTVTQRDLDSFSRLTGDFNPIHQKQETQCSYVHGALLNGIVAGIMGTKLPGPGTIVVQQYFKFPSKCVTDKPISITVEVLEVRKIIRVKYLCTQKENVVFEGEARLMMNKNFI